MKEFGPVNMFLLCTYILTGPNSFIYLDYKAHYKKKTEMIKTMKIKRVHTITY